MNACNLDAYKNYAETKKSIAENTKKVSKLKTFYVLDCGLTRISSVHKIKHPTFKNTDIRLELSPHRAGNSAYTANAQNRLQLISMLLSLSTAKLCITN